MPKPRFDGAFVSFGDIDAQPRPVQKPHPPIVVGGMSKPALRRAVRQAEGWYGFALDYDATKAAIDGLREAEEALGGRAERAALEISVTPTVPLDADMLRRYEDLGVDRLVLLGQAGSGDDMVRFIEGAAGTLP